MKNSQLRSLCLGCFLFALNFGKSQPVITEYFAMKENIKIDLNDKKLQKTINAKGILDVNWSATGSTLSISYDPKLTDSKEVMKTMQDILGLNNSLLANQPASSK